jgi:ABC-type bacteriocin/lantibiotic exporter with double-glycine peptidase domain
LPDPAGDEVHGMASAAQAAGNAAAQDHELPDGLLRYVWQEGRWQQIRLCALAALVFPLTMAPLELQRRIVDQAIGESDLRLLALLGGVYFAVVLLQGGLKYLLRFYRGVISERAIRRLRQRLPAARAGHGAEAEGEGRGQTVSIVTAEVERVGGFFGEALSEPVLQLGIFVSILGYMLVVEPMIALVSLVFFVPQLIFVPLLQRLVNRRARRKVELVREVGELIVETPAAQEGDYQDRLERIYRVRLQYYALKFLIKFLNNLLNHLAPLAVLMVGGWLVIQGDTTVGVVVAFITGFMRLADPSRELLAYYRLAAETSVQYRLITRWLSAPA